MESEISVEQESREGFAERRIWGERKMVKKTKKKMKRKIEKGNSWGNGNQERRREPGEKKGKRGMLERGSSVMMRRFG